MDLTFKTETGIFNYRVCAIILHDGKLLAMKNQQTPYYFLPGGRVHLHEAAENAILREIREELNIEPKSIRPLWLNQGFFVEDVTKDNFHELCIYYLMDISGTTIPTDVRTFEGVEKEKKHIFEWLTFAEVKEAYLYPIPVELSKKHAIRRYGFHGASLEYLSTWTAAEMQRDDLKIVCCHLGGSGSLCAVKNGISIDTTMGLSLQCGVLQNNRIGDMDPYVIFYLVEECGMELQEVKQMLQSKSGRFGISGGAGQLLDGSSAVDGGADAPVSVLLCSGHSQRHAGGQPICGGGGVCHPQLPVRYCDVAVHGFVPAPPVWFCY